MQTQLDSRRPSHVVADAGCTAQFTVTDPLGRSVGPGSNTIPEAEYVSDASDPFKLVMILPCRGWFRYPVAGTDSGSYTIGLLDMFNPQLEIITDTATVWTWPPRRSPPPTSDFRAHLHQALSPTTSLIAVTPVIQTPVRVNETVVTGRALPGQAVQIRDADSNTLLGSGQADAQGNFSITLAAL